MRIRKIVPSILHQKDSSWIVRFFSKLLDKGNK